jgi:hypothetical protein
MRIKFKEENIVLNISICRKTLRFPYLTQVQNETMTKNFDRTNSTESLEM